MHKKNSPGGLFNDKGAFILLGIKVLVSMHRYIDYRVMQQSTSGLSRKCSVRVLV